MLEKNFLAAHKFLVSHLENEHPHLLELRMNDWEQRKFGEDSHPAQLRRIVSTTRVGASSSSAADGDAKPQYSSFASQRTTYGDTFNGQRNAKPAAAAAADAPRKRSEGGTWVTSAGLRDALHQSGTTMADYQPMQRNIEQKVVIQKIHQKKQVEPGVVKLTGTRVRGVGLR